MLDITDVKDLLIGDRIHICYSKRKGALKSGSYQISDLACGGELVKLLTENGEDWADLTERRWEFLERPLQQKGE